MHRRKHSFASIFTSGCALLCLTSFAAAEDICGPVLNANLLNIYGTRTVANYQAKELDAACQTHWRTSSEFEQATKNLGSGGNYGLISGFLNLGSSDEKTALETIYDKLCVLKDANLRSWFMTETHDQSADALTNAWTACVLATKGTGVYSRLSLTPGSKQFTIKAWYRFFPVGPKLQITGYTRDRGYTCTIDNKDISNGIEVQPGQEGDFLIDCTRTADASVGVNINSVAGAIGPFDVPSDQYVALNQTLSQLSQELARVRSSARDLDARQTATRDGLLLWNASNPETGRNIAAPGAAPIESTCPSGEYAVGVRVTGNTTGQCTGCLNRIAVVCRKLNAK